MTMSVVVFTLSSIKFSSVQDAWKPVYRPKANTCSSQKFICPMTGNCTMTYLYAGKFRSQNRETVAPSGTAPGYWPHSVYDHNATLPGLGGVFVKPTMKLFDRWCSAQTTHIAGNWYQCVYDYESGSYLRGLTGSCNPPRDNGGSTGLANCRKIRKISLPVNARLA